MKLKYLFIALVSSAAVFAGCEKEVPASLDNISLSKTYLSISPAGGTAEVVVNATEAWVFEKFIEIGKDDDKKPIYGELPTWLKANVLAGVAGETKVTFTAAASEVGREQELHILAGDHTQYLIVRQGSLDAVKATCAEVAAAPDGKTVTVTGVCTSIANTSYGNWYLKDDTGEVYIYGTVDANGQYNWASFNIEVGDEVTVEGPKKDYNGTIELVDASVVKVVKALVSLDKSKVEVSKDGGSFIVKAAYKGNGVFVTMPEQWAGGEAIEGAVEMTGMEYVKGVASKLVPNPADTAVIKFRVAPSEVDARSCTVVVSSANEKQTSSLKLTVEQESGLDYYLNETFAEGLGMFIIRDRIPAPSGIWTHDAKYACAKATSGAAGEYSSILVSPEIDLSTATSATLSFMHACNKIKDRDVETTLWFTADDGTTWEQLLIPVYATNWTFVSSGDISLAKALGKKVKIGFLYKSLAASYGTWEIKNVTVTANAPVLTGIAGVINSTVAASTSWEATLKDAVVTYVNGKSAFIEDATGGIQLFKDGHGLVPGQVFNGTVKGKVSLYNGYAEATDWDASEATVTTKEVITPTVLTIAQLKSKYLRFQNCYVELDGVTFTTAVTKSNRNGMITQTIDSVSEEIAVYAQVKNTLEMNGTGNLVCLPTRYNEKLQVGVFENSQWITK